MTDRIEKYGKPTAKKVRDAGWWLPAVTTPMGPKPLPHGERQWSAYQARKEAARILRKADKGPDE